MARIDLKQLNIEGNPKDSTGGFQNDKPFFPYEYQIPVWNSTVSRWEWQAFPGILDGNQGTQRDEHTVSLGANNATDNAIVEERFINIDNLAIGGINRLHVTDAGSHSFVKFVSADSANGDSHLELNGLNPEDSALKLSQVLNAEALGTDVDGNVIRSTIKGNRHIPTPIISTCFHKKLNHKRDYKIYYLVNTPIQINANGNNPVAPVVYFGGGTDPNQSGVTFSPNYQNQRGVIYREENTTVNNYKYDGSSYVQHNNTFSFDDIVNQGVIWLGSRAESGQDLSFFFANTPMLVCEVYTSIRNRNRKTTRLSLNDAKRWKKWQSWNFQNDNFENLNRPLNTNETGSDGLVSNNGCKYFATQWNFTPTTPNSEMLFRLDVHALFGYAKSSATPDFQFPLKETDFYQNNSIYQPRYTSTNGVQNYTIGERYPTAFRQRVRFRFACIDPKDTRNLLYSEPTQAFYIKMAGGYFQPENDNYLYRFDITKGI